MATVSDIKFFGESEGRCPECGRSPVMLGRVNVAALQAYPPACIDCCFGPPREFWVTCQACGWWQPEGEVCDKCGGTDMI